MRGGFLVLTLCCTIAFPAILAPASDLKEVVERLPSGVINWSQGIVVAKGSGAPPPGAQGPAQARLMAERAAKADALRNLLEAVQGVRVNAETTVENFTTKSDRVMTRVSGIVKGATMVDKRYLSDGGVEVTMAVSLTGELLAVMVQEALPSTPPTKPRPPQPPPPPPKETKVVTPPPAEEKRVPEKPVTEPKIPAATEKPLPPPPPKETKVVTPPPAEEKRAPEPPQVQAKVEEKLDLKKLDYSGLIVDARKLGLRPALIPKILDQRGELVYSAQNLEQQELIRMGLVGYAKDVSAAAKNQRVTADPVVISGLNAIGEKKTDVVISNRDAQIVLTTAPYTGYLKNGRVMIVYD